MLLLAMLVPVLPLGSGAVHGSVAAPQVDAWPGADAVRALRASAANDADGDGVFDAFWNQLAAAGVPLPSIVTLVHGTPVASVLPALHATGLRPDGVFDALGMISVPLDAAAARFVAGLPGVRQVEGADGGEPLMQRAAVLGGARIAQDSFGVDGSGVTVALFDLGFDPYAAGLAGRFAAVHEFGSGATRSDHGTRVARVLAGAYDDPTWNGVAPGVELIGLVIGADAPKRNTIEAIEWILDHPEAGVDLANISFGFGQSVDGTDAIEIGFSVLWEHGVATFSSNGNEGPEPGHVSVPSGSHGVLGIGSLSVHDSGFSLSPFSSRGVLADGRIKPDFVAPGGGIQTLDIAAGRPVVSANSGTSFASPFAAGVAALVLSLQPELDPDGLAHLLREGAVDWGPAGLDVDYGFGSLDAAQAVLVASASAAPTDVRLGVGHVQAADRVVLESAEAARVWVTAVRESAVPATVVVESDALTKRMPWSAQRQTTLEVHVPAGSAVTIRVEGSPASLDVSGDLVAAATLPDARSAPLAGSAQDLPVEMESFSAPKATAVADGDDGAWTGLLVARSSWRGIDATQWLVIALAGAVAGAVGTFLFLRGAASAPVDAPDLRFDPHARPERRTDQQKR